jgi:two-component sensor histidine kinase
MAFSPLDRTLSRTHGFLTKHRLAVTILAWAIYATTVLVFGTVLAISSNYLVILPVLFTAIGYGLYGGIISGLAGLPANLLLFWLLGHLDYSPASKPIAELAGLLVGSSLGYLSDYYRKLKLEMERRSETESKLRQALVEKDVLLKEVQHRVKNNLNVIKSLINLQASRSADQDFKREAKILIDRIFSISLVQELLYARNSLDAIDLKEYFEGLVRNIVSGFGSVGLRLELDIESVPGASIDMAVPLGLIVNEVLTNTLKHAFVAGRSSASGGSPRIDVEFKVKSCVCVLSIADNGPGFDPVAVSQSRGLGIKLIETLSAQLGASFQYSFDPGARFELTFPFPWRNGRDEFPAADRRIADRRKFAQ